MFFFFKQKTAYEMRISDWSSDVCSSDLPEDIRAYVPDCPLVHGDVLALPALRDAIDVYAFDDLARDLATEIADEDGAVRVIGQEPGDAGRFYALLTAFKIEPDAARTAAALASVPILKTGTGFISASRGRQIGRAQV